MIKQRSPGFLGFLGRAAFALGAVLAIGAPLGPVAALTGSDRFDIPPKAQTLTNGLRVVVVEDHAAPVVQTAMWYRFGANDERPGQAGLAHALERMMYSGTFALSQAGLDDVTARLGAREQATTTNDYTAFRFLVPADKLDLMLRIEADRMQHLSLAEKTWKPERAELLAEIDRALSQPLTKLYDAVCRAASRERVCALSPLGERRDVARASAQDLRSYYQDWYSPAGATLVIVGDVRASDAFASAREAFGAVPRGDPPPHAGVAAEYEIDQHVEVGGDFPYPVVDIAFAAPGTLDADAPAYRIIDSVINNQRSDFYKALVTSGYTVGYSTQLDQNLHGGLYHVFLIVAPGHTSSQVRDAFTGVLTDAQSGGFPPDLIDAAKTQASRAALYAHDSLATLGARVGYAVAAEGIADPHADDERLAAVSADAVTIVARKDMRRPAATGMLSPTEITGAIPPPPQTAIDDDFSKRPPAGRTVEAYWVRNLLDAPSHLASRVRPVTFTLANGLRLYVDAVHANPTVFVRGSVATSPRFDAAGKEGEGAMLSTLLGYGGQKYDFEAERRVADDLGAGVDLGENFELHGRSHDLIPLLEIVADSLERPALAAEDVDVVRRQTLEAVRQRDNDPEARADKDFEALLLAPNDPALRESDEASIAAISQNDLRAYAREYVRPDLTTISVTGDVEPQAVLAAVDRVFGSWHARGPTPSVAPPDVPPPHAARRYVVTSGATISARLGEAAPARGSRDFDTLLLIDRLLGAGGTWDTRLPLALLDDSKLALAASSSLTSDRYRGTWNFRVTAEPGKIDAAVAALRAELARLLVDPVGPFELDRVRTKAIAEAEVAEEATSVIAGRVQQIGQDQLPLDYETTLPRRYATIDGAAILRAAQTYLHPDDLIEIYEGPHA
jgi:zinc protease